MRFEHSLYIVGYDLFCVSGDGALLETVGDGAGLRCWGIVVDGEL